MLRFVVFLINNQEEEEEGGVGTQKVTEKRVVVRGAVDRERFA